MNKWPVGAAEDIAPGDRMLVHVAGHEIGIFNVGGAFYAVLNRCPHQGAPVCRGAVDGTLLASRPNEYIWGRDGEVLRCPWHGWEYEIATGQALAQPRIRLKTYRVEVEAGQLLLWV